MKTWTSGRLIARLLAAGKRVGVACTSHKAIHKLLAETEQAGLNVTGVKKSSAGNPESIFTSAHITSADDRQACLAQPICAGTAWLFTLTSTARWTIFIDEAGQVSLADALAMGTAARNLVLVGDPQQLSQVTQGTHPLGVAASVLEHLLDGQQTIPADSGVFLGETFRLHPDICGYISEEFYRNRLLSSASCAGRTSPLGTGLRFCPVQHEHCRQESRAEATRVVCEIDALRGAGVTEDEIIVLAPYNAHVNLLRGMLPAAVRVGTVDKFQGQEARVALYTMASSNSQEIPRGLEFLLSVNRRRDLACPMPRLPHLQSTPARRRLQHDRADAPRKRSLQIR